MIPVSPSSRAPIEFDVQGGVTNQKIRVSSSKIGWLHSKAENAGATFDLVIKDALGRVRFERKGFGSETDQAGELLNIPTMVGEEMEIEIKNPQNVGKLHMFIN